MLVIVLGWLALWGPGSAPAAAHPYQQLTRQRLAVVVVRSLGWDMVARGQSPGQVARALARFRDRASIDSSCAPYVALAVRRGLVRGDGSRHLHPTKPATRAQSARVADRAGKIRGHRKVPLIVLDPGHGGADAGARGVRTGRREKTVNLAIARAAAKYLRRAGLGTVLTRSSDKTVGLADRADRANRVGADLLVSIHTNTAGRADPRERGTITFYDVADGVASVGGARLAQLVQKHVVDALSTADGGSRDWFGQRLYILRRTAMPAVLVECGFLSNARDEAKLVAPTFERRAGRGIAEAILEYLGRD